MTRRFLPDMPRHLALLALAACGGSSSPPAAPVTNTPLVTTPDAPPSIAGSYVSSHPIRVVCVALSDGW